MMLPVHTQKANLRQTLLQQRRSLPKADWHSRSQAICAHLQRDDCFNQARTILSYFSFQQEPCLYSLIELPKVWGFPRCVGSSLVWHQWSIGLPLQVGKYGIPEPDPNLPLVESTQADLILVPAIGCDHRGYRLGYGGGYYDRLMGESSWKKKMTIGIIFEFAYLPELPVDPWDQPLSLVCTELGIRNCR